MQSNTDWHYLSNQFEASLSSYGDTLTFINDHTSKLENAQANVVITPLLANTVAARNVYTAAYSTWETANAFWKGATHKIDGLLLDLTQKHVPRWDAMVQTYFLENTDEYITLFPNGRTAFREGGKDAQIRAVRTFLNTIPEYPDLEPLGILVTNFLALLEDARNKQQQREQSVRDTATDLRAAQQTVYTTLYANLGWLMFHYAADTTPILNYYSVELIRTTGAKKKQDEIPDVPPIDENADPIM